ncbi:MAG: cadherin-like beta sandwich domain-containing protein [Bacteroidales bacterium]|jgi:hypothetical protein|nr:cadherin-like beta sandwich domain-containing protein [Bacteroidales bacterium]
MTKTHLLSTILFIILTLYLSKPVSSQQTINLNETNTDLSVLQNKKNTTDINNFGDFVNQYRLFNYNPQLKSVTKNNCGDTILLDFFDDKKYKGKIIVVEKSYDNIIGISAQILNTSFGFCYISISETGISISAELPQIDICFSTKEIDNQIYLTEQIMSKIYENTLYETTIIDSCTDKTNSSQIKNYIIPKTLEPNYNPITIDLLVVYTATAKQWADNNANGIDLLINEATLRANTTLTNSNTNLTINVVYKHQTNYTESTSANTDLTRLTSTNDGYMDEVHVLRRQYNADMITLLADLTQVGGVGWTLSTEYGNSKNACSVIKVTQAASKYSMLHELCHNMGCTHHKAQPDNGLYSYSHGWRDISSEGTKYSTVMSYETGSFYSDPSSYPRIPYLSDPDIMFEDSPIGDINDGNNALTVRKTKSVVATYSDELPYMDSFLQNIIISTGSLSPAFSPAIRDYQINVNNQENSISIEGIPNYQGASVNGNVTDKPLSIGNNYVTLVVTNAWGNVNANQTYNITISRANIPSSDASLASLVVNPGELTPAFEPNILNYSVILPTNTTDINITATPNSSGAIVSGNGNYPLQTGDNIIPISITAEDTFTTQTYIITITIENNIHTETTTTQNISFSPNPVSVNSQIQLEINKLSENIIVDVFDEKGKHIQQIQIKESTTINAPSVAGCYFYVFKENNKKIKTHKIIVK